MTDHITVYAPTHIDPVDSYGLIACELVRHLTRLGIYVSAVSRGDSHHSNQDDEVREYCSKPIVPTTGGILLGYPTGFVGYGVMANLKPKIAVTMFESSKLPEAWIKPLNECDAVIVPSTFCETSFLESGVTTPIYRIPLGIDPRYTVQGRSSGVPFRFLAFLDRGRRKGGLESIDSFYEEFGDDPNVHLTLKHRDRKGKVGLEFTNKNIDVISKDMTVEELNDLYGSCHCLVNPNKGEGFGLIPREFAATGGISLTSNWGGTADLIDLWGHSIECALEKADWKGHKTFQGQDLGVWASPIRADIRRKMRHIYEERKIFQGIALQNSYMVKSIYKWETFAEGVLDVWKELTHVYA